MGKITCQCAAAAKLQNTTNAFPSHPWGPWEGQRSRAAVAGAFVHHPAQPWPPSKGQSMTALGSCLPWAVQQHRVPRQDPAATSFVAMAGCVSEHLFGLANGQICCCMRQSEGCSLHPLAGAAHSHVPTALGKLPGRAGSSFPTFVLLLVPSCAVTSQK